MKTFERMAWVLASAALCGTLACSKSGQEGASEHHSELAVASATASAPSAAPSASAPAAVASAPEPAEAPIPNERRAERKAAAEINSANYKAELTKIAKEIGTK